MAAKHSSRALLNDPRITSHKEARQNMSLPEDRSPIFIVGVGRSGTTLLRKILGNHPNIAIPYESHFITKYYQSLEQYGDLNNEGNLRKIVADILDEALIKQWDHAFNIETVIDKISDRSLSGIIDAIYQDYAEARGKKRWGDKSDYLDRMHIINKIFPASKFIHIIRDGRDVASSVLSRPWGPTDIIQAAEWWRDHVRLGRCMGSILGDARYTEIKYEDLVTKPESELMRICSFLGEEYSCDMLNYYNNHLGDIPENRVHQHYNNDKPPQTDRVFAWKREMSSWNRQLFDNISKDELIANGYEVWPPTANRGILTIAKAIIYFRRMFR